MRKIIRVHLLPVYSSLGSYLLGQALRTEDQLTKSSLMAKALYNLELGKNCEALWGQFKLAMFYYAIGQYSTTLDIMAKAIDRLTKEYGKHDPSIYTSAGDISAENKITKSNICSHQLEHAYKSSYDTFGTFVVCTDVALSDPVSYLQFFPGDVTFGTFEVMPESLKYELTCTNAHLDLHEESWRPLILRAVIFYYLMQCMCFLQLGQFENMKQAVEDFGSFLKTNEDSCWVQAYYNLLQSSSAVLFHGW